MGIYVKDIKSAFRETRKYAPRYIAYPLAAVTTIFLTCLKLYMDFFKHNHLDGDDRIKAE